MTRFYTAVTQYGNSMLYNEIVDGKLRIRKVPFELSLYTKLPEGTESNYVFMERHPLKKMTFHKNINAANEYVERYKDVSNYDFLVTQTGSISSSATSIRSDGYWPIAD